MKNPQKDTRFQHMGLFKKTFIFVYSVYFQVMKFLWTYWAGYLLAMTSMISFFFPEKIKKKIQYAFASLWARGLVFLGGLRYAYTVSPKVDFKKPALYVGNHSSALDIYIYQTVIHTFVNWVAKRSLFNVPFLGTAMWLMGHVPVYRDEDLSHLRKTLDMGVKRLRDGYSLCVFPEGTRSYDGKLLPFKKGAFAMAKMAKVPIIPVIIKNAWRVAPKGRWIINVFLPLEIKILDPIDSSDKDIVEKVKRRMQEALDS